MRVASPLGMTSYVAYIAAQDANISRRCRLIFLYFSICLPRSYYHIWKTFIVKITDAMPDAKRHISYAFMRHFCRRPYFTTHHMNSRPWFRAASTRMGAPLIRHCRAAAYGIYRATFCKLVWYCLCCRPPSRRQRTIDAALYAYQPISAIMILHNAYRFGFHLQKEYLMASLYHWFAVASYYGHLLKSISTLLDLSIVIVDHISRKWYHY